MKLPIGIGLKSIEQCSHESNHRIILDYDVSGFFFCHVCIVYNRANECKPPLLVLVGTHNTNRGKNTRTPLQSEEPSNEERTIQKKSIATAAYTK